MSSRITRSQSAKIGQTDPIQPPEPPPQAAAAFLRHKNSRLTVQYTDETALASLLQALPRKDQVLLRQKQKKLQGADAQITAFIEGCLVRSNVRSASLARAASATLVFAWEAAGTALCISPGGLLLTCSHCVAETKNELRPDMPRWLLFASGHPVQARCIAWDSQRDLALLQIIVAPSSLSEMPYIRVSPTAPRLKAELICIGHPGSEDFEAATPGVATNYDVLHVSEGCFRGMAKDQDPQNNYEIGALMHDCWTYWGHSGAPLLETKNGMLVGLHSSWDHETGMRRGVGWEALKAFLDAEVRNIGPTTEYQKQVD